MRQPSHDPEQPRQPGSARPVDSGRAAEPPGYGPLIPGGYPPLGYAADGTALYTPGQQTDTEKRRIEDAQRAAVAQAARDARDARFAELSAEEHRRPWTRAPVLGLAALAIVVVLVTMFAFTRGGGDDAQFAERTIPPATQPPDPSPLPSDGPNFEDEFSDEPSTLPVPGNPGGPQSIPEGEPVDYEVTLDGPGTIFYSDDTGLRAEFVPPSTWTRSFVSGDYPLHLTVIPAPNSAASCVVRVAGEELIRDEISGESMQDTARCVP